MIYKLRITKKNLIKTGDFKISQKHQVLNLADWCNECGNCTTFCPTSGIPYKDKPKVYFHKKSFADNGDGYLVEKVGKEHQLTVKSNGNTGTFSETWDAYIYEEEVFTAVFNKESLDMEHIDIYDNEIVDISLGKIPEMLTIFKATKDLVVE